MKFKEQISGIVYWHGLFYFMFHLCTEFDILWFYICASLH